MPMAAGTSRDALGPCPGDSHLSTDLDDKVPLSRRPVS